MQSRPDQVRIEATLLQMADALRLLLKDDQVFWEPEASSERVLPALRALEREVAAAAVAPERAAPVLSRLREVRVWVGRLYEPRGPVDESAAASRAFQTARTRALLALQQFREAVGSYFDALFGRPHER
jgi:hypothetical protein